MEPKEIVQALFDQFETDGVCQFQAQEAIDFLAPRLGQEAAQDIVVALMKIFQPGLAQASRNPATIGPDEVDMAVRVVERACR